MYNVNLCSLSNFFWRILSCYVRLPCPTIIPAETPHLYGVVPSLHPHRFLLSLYLLYFPFFTRRMSILHADWYYYLLYCRNNSTSEHRKAILQRLLKVINTDSRMAIITKTIDRNLHRLSFGHNTRSRPVTVRFPAPTRAHAADPGCAAGRRFAKRSGRESEIICSPPIRNGTHQELSPGRFRYTLQYTYLFLEWPEISFDFIFCASLTLSATSILLRNFYEHQVGLGNIRFHF